MELKLNDRVKTTEAEVMDRIDGTGEILIPAGHGGTVVATESGSFAASAQARWRISQVKVALDPIDGMNYTLKTNSGFFEPEKVP